MSTTFSSFNNLVSANHKIIRYYYKQFTINLKCADNKMDSLIATVHKPKRISGFNVNFLLVKFKTMLTVGGFSTC